MKGNLIIVEGTDCSGKETQTKLLVEKLNELNHKVIRLCFPRYDTPTGRIIAGPYLGKEGYDKPYFSETSANVDSLVSTLYFAADRKYNSKEIIDYINQGYIVIIDRYVTSNMAHQGGKIFDEKKRKEMYNKITTLEYDILELPKPDLTVFLYMPYEYSKELKKNREELPDQNEQSELHLRNAEKTYLEMAELYNFKTINCVTDNKIRTIENINNELLDKVIDFLNNK